jgi:hypothetical protein
MQHPPRSKSTQITKKSLGKTGKSENPPAGKRAQPHQYHANTNTTAKNIKIITSINNQSRALYFPSNHQSPILNLHTA